MNQSNRYARFYGILLVAFSSTHVLTGFGDDSGNFSEAERNHWAFQSVVRPEIPGIRTGQIDRLQNEIDAFIVRALQKSSTDLLPVADRLTLIRRLSFDLIGLPPTPDEASEFLADDSPDAYERLVDRLLANPHYGEAWGRIWLDVVRYADTSGFNADPARPVAYKYRDYVIRAFNRDLPYSRFIQEQLAGDELFPDDVEAVTATGYCRMWADESNASNIHLARQLALNDLTGNLGAAVLGLSIGCAQCHDHKFDPLLQTDFYQLQAFFSGIVLEDQMSIGSHEQVSEYHRQLQKWLEQTAELRHELQAIERDARIKLHGDRRMKFPADVLAAIDCLPEERTVMQRQLAFWSERQMTYKNEDLPKQMTDETKARRDELLNRLVEAKQTQPKPPQEFTVMAVSERTLDPPKTHFLMGGSYDKPQQELSPHFPTILRAAATQSAPMFAPPNERSTGRRSELARWLTTPNHPLTYRVWVNRIWQGHFGRGLVENANDFGLLTPRPALPELLDWLTSEFVARGSQTKDLHRQIVLSATYRQQAQGIDPANTSTAILPHASHRRLTAERIRDAWLAASGAMNDSMFGPGIRPELPPNFGGVANWKLSEPSERSRRSIYIYAKRNLPYPLLAAFDFPDMHESCGCRTSTTIAPQALTLLNSDLIVNAARLFAARTRDHEGSAKLEPRIAIAWQIAYGRPPTAHETEMSLNFVTNQKRLIAETNSNRVVEENNRTQDDSSEEAFVDLCHAILNGNEFLFID